MIKIKENSLKELMGELFLIIGGFILAETIINKFIELSSNVIPIWILPSLSLLLIITALDLKNNKSLFKAGILPSLFLGGSIVLIVLMKKGIISNIAFLEYIAFLSLFGVIIQIILYLMMKYGKKR